MRHTLIAVALLGCGAELAPPPEVPLDSLSDKTRTRIAVADKNHDGVLAGHELAHYYATRTHRVFRKLDRNGDGKLDRTEVPATMLANADRNGDGVVTVDEFVALHNARVLDRVRAADANGDGVLEPSELGALRWTRLQQADANGDGKLTLDELQHTFGRSVP